VDKRVSPVREKEIGGTARDGWATAFSAHLFPHRGHLLTFLYDPSVKPTNNLAERQLRPAVITRKLSAGNRSPQGARTHALLASLAATCRQRGQRFTELATALLRQPAYLPALSPL
jgi:hypothetical protein